MVAVRRTGKQKAEKPESAPPPPSRGEMGLVFVAVFAGAVLFALWTNHAWEDYYITLRSSRHLAEGHGLVHQPGERVQAFSSPLNTLATAFFARVTGPGTDAAVLWLGRLLSSAALGAAAVLLFCATREGAWGFVPSLVLLGMFATDAKILDFSINGQETAFMMLFLSLALRAHLRPPSGARALGLAWAGLLWSRTDGLVYGACLAVGFFVFFEASPLVKSRLDLLKRYGRALAVAAVMYSPWLIGAWVYYGSPVPHTVVAKGLVRLGALNAVDLLGKLLTFPFSSFVKMNALQLAFLPAYSFFGSWPTPVSALGFALAWLCAFYWVLPFGRARTRAASVAFLLAAFYITHVAGWEPWYLPNAAIFGFVVLAGIVHDALPRARTAFVARGAAFGILALGLGLTVCVGYQMRIRQQIVEDENRKEVGRWLRENATSPTDSVFLEPLGYIGYFSGMKTYDFPGLSSPEVVAIRRRYGGRAHWSTLIGELQPTWIVLRPPEVAQVQAVDAELLRGRYHLAKTFDVSPRIAAVRWLPGRAYLNNDAVFLVYRRSQ
jgi:hypothetical protein